MFKILDRYLVREVVLPFFLGLMVLTFVLVIPPILNYGEKLIAKGVDWHIVVRLLLTLLPQALGITIPMALLLGLLIGLGRLSADREFVAIQACGVSIFSLLRPVAAMAAAAWAATAYVMIVSLPNANQTFREITYHIVAARAESDVKPRVFFDGFPGRVIYVRDLPAGGGWRDVFLADATRGDQTTVYFAETGRLLLDREKQLVQLMLENGTRHTTFVDKPEDYEGTVFESIVLNLDPETVFPRVSLMKGEPEMTLAELRASVAAGAKVGDPAYNQRLMIQQKFSFPAACFVLALLGLGLGVTSRKEGMLSSFVLGLSIIFAYYIILWTARSIAKGAMVPAELAPWLPNILLGAAGMALLFWRAGSADQSIRISVPGWLPLRGHRSAACESAPAVAAKSAPRRSRAVLVVKMPHVDLPRPRLLDRYITRQYLHIFGLAFLGLLGLFYVSTLVDMLERLVRGTATSSMLLRYMYFATPQFVYYIIPISALVATLVTVGLLTKNSELVVMRACGVSLYRSAVPLLLFALAGSGALFGLQEWVLAESNRRAEGLRHVMRGFPARTFDVLERRWVVGSGGDIYHYAFFDPRLNRFSDLLAFHVSEKAWRLETLTHAKDVALARRHAGDAAPVTWTGRQGWVREFFADRRKNAVTYQAFAERGLSLERPDYFKTEEPDAERMTYGQLKRYIVQLQASGFDIVPHMVALQRKIAFPFVTVIMTVLAVPFAVMTGRRGALYGIGIGIVLAIVYWTTQSVFAAVGSGGLIAPMLAAWAPNILFGAAAAYMLLTVRT
jgi:LPS export ABC transporter permease LptG/LPS export ABC transporter permease LptF